MRLYGGKTGVRLPNSLSISAVSNRAALQYFLPVFCHSDRREESRISRLEIPPFGRNDKKIRQTNAAHLLKFSGLYPFGVAR